MTIFTCLSCHVAFIDMDGQRDHFRSDWHRYNLMRKVVELPPVSREVYNERVGQISSPTSQGSTTQKIHCGPCNKTFGTQNAYDNHIQSKKHLGIVLSVESRKRKNHQKKKAVIVVVEEEDIEVEEVDSDEWEGEAVELLECLMCGLHCESLEVELLHLTQEHSFFIPDLQYCVDLPGLITYLGEKIGCGYECLGCNWTAKRNPSVTSVRKHMNDKGHLRIMLDGDGLVEYADFYDYSSSYPDGGEVVSEKEEVNATTISEEGYELVLPSGTTIGHRSLFRYYRQKLDPNRKAVMLKKSGTAFHSLMAKYHALGWNGATKADLVRKHRDLKYWTAMKSKHLVNLSTKANKLSQSQGRGTQI